MSPERYGETTLLLFETSRVMHAGIVGGRRPRATVEVDHPGTPYMTSPWHREQGDNPQNISTKVTVDLLAAAVLSPFDGPWSGGALRSPGVGSIPITAMERDSISSASSKI